MAYTVKSNDPQTFTLNETDEVKNILQNIRIILTTPKGTDVMYRDFGLDWSFIDKPVSVARIMIIPLVREAIQQWEPRATVQNVRYEADGSNPGKMVVAVEVEIDAGT